ncbi:MAG: hypothetical protein U0X91_27660 [Spirosomataceae bacterium]
MQIKLFTIPLTDDGTAQAELNRFLAEQRFFISDCQHPIAPLLSFVKRADSAGF